MLPFNQASKRPKHHFVAALLVVLSACSEEIPPGGGGVCQDNLGCRTGNICIRTACIPVASVDQDGDGIPDSVEERLGTDPQRRDSDNDGIPDGQEVQFDEERNDWNAPDADGDGQPDALEDDSGDQDDDGVPDAVDPCDEDPDCPVVGGAHPPCRANEGEPCAAGIGQCAVVGRTRCTQDGQDVICEGQTGSPTAEVCDALDNDCDGSVDEDFEALGNACTIGVGQCVAQGEFTCADDGSITCTGSPLPATLELCDGLDNDCDGALDEDFDDLGSECMVGTDECLIAGLIVCDLDSGETTCSYEPSPETEERCDGQDNDCDGAIDEDFPTLGSDCTRGAGICANAGTVTCAAGGREVECNAQLGMPAGELCNGLDDDCDGETDEVFPGLGSACAVGRGGCRRESMTACSEDGAGTTCPVSAGQPEFEICDEQDNDCDGTIDEQLGVGGACTVGTGRCQREGQFVCQIDTRQLVCSVDAAEPEEERCDGFDNDCDGELDEDFALGRFCEIDQDGCILPGQLVCDPETELPACLADQELVIEERCDDRDNDCDGQIDEGLELGAACEIGEGLCASVGERICGQDGSVVCAAIGPPGSPEVCDGIDNDCDFIVDEDFVLQGLGEGCTSGVGACARNGVLVCAADQEALVCDAVVGEPVAERCDGLDNDCDGRFDEDFPNLALQCDTGLGICRRVDRFECTADGEGLICPATAGEAADETCNQLDDDCDGESDENFPTLGQVCTEGLGACAQEGIFQCDETGVGVSCSATALAPNEERCDNIDNDCDGQIDEGYDVNCEPLAIEVVAGGYGTCRVASDGTTDCFGSVRRQPPEATLTALSAGGDTYCGILDDGTLVCWGQPVAVPDALGTISETAVSANGQVCIIRTIDDRIRCFGQPFPADVLAPEGPIRGITAGFDFACAIDRATSQPLCWGSADFGVLGTPDVEMTQIDSGSSATCGLRLDGQIQCWGEDLGGQLDPPDGVFTALSMGGYTGCALNEDGQLRCWGIGLEDDGAQYGQGVPPDGRYRAVSMGAAHGCGLTQTNALRCWGAGGPDDGNVFPHAGQSTVPR